MADEQFTAYVSWTKDGHTNTEEVSAFGGVSSDEDDEPGDLFSDDCGGVEGGISINGDLFTAAFSRLPVLAVRPDGTTTDVDEHDDGHGGTHYNIFFRCIGDLCDMTFELRLFFDMIEAPPLVGPARCSEGHAHACECRHAHGEWIVLGDCLGQIMEEHIRIE